MTTFAKSKSAFLARNSGREDGVVRTMCLLAIFNSYMAHSKNKQAKEREEMEAEERRLEAIEEARQRVREEEKEDEEERDVFDKFF